MNFASLKKNVKRGANGLPIVKLAVLGDTPTQLLCQALAGYGIEVGIDLHLFEAEYDQIERQILDASSELYASKPKHALIFGSTEKLHARFAKTGLSQRASFAEEQIARTRDLVVRLEAAGCNALVCNFPEPGDDVFGNFANKTEVSFTYQLRKLNFELMNLAREMKGLFIVDLAAAQMRPGRERSFSPSQYVTTGMVYEVEGWVDVAKAVVDVLMSLRGAARKALVLDLDNTTWGGVIGDDGIENIEIGELGIGRAFTELQTWAKQLKERGILLAVCSKNDEAVAKQPFEQHPDMVLRLSDIAVFVANWENKVDNLRHIQRVLNISFDAMAFIDDNPFERNIVRAGIPEICVPELPVDPAEYAPYLRNLNLFETSSFSEEDQQRTRQYQDEAKRTSFQRSFDTEGAYLASLDMASLVKPFDRFDTPRIAQLSQRSNQFNLRTVRYTERDIEAISGDPDCIGLSFTLSDRFGDHGLIAVAILRAQDEGAAFIDTWFMSCRVLKRGMEAFVLNTIAARARARGLSRLVGEYLPTAKNAMVKDHYQSLGFAPAGDRWELALDTHVPTAVHIREKEAYESRSIVAAAEHAI